jgi:hypothetical protein
MFSDLTHQVGFESILPPADLEARREVGDVPMELGNVAQFCGAVRTEGNYARANPQRNLFHTSQVRIYFVVLGLFNVFSEVFRTPWSLPCIFVKAQDQSGNCTIGLDLVHFFNCEGPSEEKRDWPTLLFRF